MSHSEISLNVRVSSFTANTLTVTFHSSCPNPSVTDNHQMLLQLVDVIHFSLIESLLYFSPNFVESDLHRPSAVVCLT